MALGSGFIIDPAGYIVTNNHVVANQGSVTVIIQDKAGITAKVIGRDEKTGTVLLEIDTDKKLPYATWGDSDDRAGRRLGLSLSANPFGLDGSVTARTSRRSPATWGWLGVAIQNVAPAIAKSLGLDPDHPMRALVASVTSDSPAAKADINKGDVIIKAGDHEIQTIHDLPRRRPDRRKLPLTIFHGGKRETVEAMIGEMPQKTAE